MFKDSTIENTAMKLIEIVKENFASMVYLCNYSAIVVNQLCLTV